MMKYISTRGKSNIGGFSDLLLEGLVSDGGLVIPKALPKVTVNTLESWRKLSYADLAFEILSLFVNDIPLKDLKSIIKKTYRPEIFNNEEDIVVLKPLYDGLFLLNLSQGPTFAFKDIAMQLLGNMFEYTLSKRRLTLNIVGATSGDTGSAAEYAFRDRKNIAVFMLSPYGRMSSFQESQMYSLDEKNIHNLSIQGVFDEAQDIVKFLSSDIDWKHKYHLGIVNSINWARIAAQLVYYFYGWLHSTTRADQKVSFAVPSGNFGNILAGYYAKNMGLPIHRLILATNENNVLEEFFRIGIYKPRLPKDVYFTSSPSMDISRASNLERFIFELVDKDSEKVQYLWDKLNNENTFDLSELKHLFENKHGFIAAKSTHTDRIEMIRWVYKNFRLIIDPHTANAMKTAKKFSEPDIPVLVLETAQAIKFPDTIKEALGSEIPRSDFLEKIEKLPKYHKVLGCDPIIIKKYIEKYAVMENF